MPCHSCIGCNRLLRGKLDLGRSGKVGETLRQVDGAMQHRLARHFADHRFREVCNPAAKKRFLVDGCFGHKM
jgi:hypothetical protein